MESLHDSLARNEHKIARVRKTRLLPLPGEVLVNVGDKVEPNTAVAKISLRPGIPWVLPAARLLGIPTEQLSSCMLKKIGEQVKTKEIFARSPETGLYGRKDLESPTNGVIEDVSDRSGRVVIREEFGREEPPINVDVAFELKCRPKELRKHMLRLEGQEVKSTQILAKKGEGAAFFSVTCQAPISGVITEINEQTGYVTISRPFKEVVVDAYLRGVITDTISDRGVVVEVPAVKINGVFGVGKETFGELKMIVDKPDEVVTEDMITPDLAGKIVVGGSFVTNDAMAKALEVGCNGLITGTVNYLNIITSLGLKLGVGITGQEDIPTTLILIEGFGHLAMHDEIFYALKALDGREACINGATQIRAGAIRPEIVVPFPDYDGDLAEEEKVEEEITTGVRVRVINEPYFGATGFVSNVPRESFQVETEAKVPVLEVELTDGRKVMVPRPNVEVF